MAIDLVSRLDRGVSESEHHVCEALVLAMKHPEGDRVAERIQRDVRGLALALTGHLRAYVHLLGGLLDQPADGCLAHTIGLPARKKSCARLKK